MVAIVAADSPAPSAIVSVDPLSYVTPNKSKRTRSTTLTNGENFAQSVTEAATEEGISEVIQYLRLNPECITVAQHMCRKGLLKPSAKDTRKELLPAGNSRFAHVSKGNLRVLLLGALDGQLDAIRLSEAEDGDRDFTKKYFQFLFKISFKSPLPSRCIQYLTQACKERLSLVGERFCDEVLPTLGEDDDDIAEYNWVSKKECKVTTRVPGELTHVRHRFTSVTVAPLALRPWHRLPTLRC